MDPDRPEKPYPPLPIELMPLPPESSNERMYPPLPGGHGDNSGPVPERPLHLCPTCDYILTGIPERRCPECGQPFTLFEARQRAIDKENNPSISEILRSDNPDLVKYLGGLGLAALAFAMPWALHPGPSARHDDLVLAIILFLIVFTMAGGWYTDRYNYDCERTFFNFKVSWPDIAIPAGIVMIVASVITMIV